MDRTKESVLPEGTRLGDAYRILRPLEMGPQSITYLAEANAEEERQFVALKVTAAGSLRPEAYRLAGVRSGSFPRFYRVFQDGPRSCLAMEYIAGVSLQAYLFGTQDRPGRGKLADEEVVAIGMQLCDALEALHSRRPPLIFCGLRPAHVLLDTQRAGRARLPDLSVARPGRPAAQQHDLPPLSIRGPEGYLPPEYDGEISPSTDIYALGATLWVVSTGEESWAKRQLRLSRSDTPLARLLRSMVEPNPRRRPATVTEVRDALLRLSRSYATPASVSDVLQPGLKAWLASA